MKQAQVARAIDILRAAPLTAAQFAERMWPDRRAPDGGERSRSQLSHAGHAFLRRLGALGYVDRVGDLWMIRQFSASGSADASAAGSADLSALGLPNGSQNGSTNHPSLRRVNGSSDGQVDQQRLIRLVEQATEPVDSVTSDRALGDIRVRSIALDAALVEACAWTVLHGRSANIYPPCGAPQMLVGLSPVEGARALFLRWQQSGQPPELPRAGAWITVEDGIVATPGFWRPHSASAGWFDREDVRARIGRQRANAGLA